MTSRPSKTHVQHANAIYEAYRDAFLDGYRLEGDKRGFIDLVDKDGNREAVFSLELKERQ